MTELLKAYRWIVDIKNNSIFKSIRVNFFKKLIYFEAYDLVENHKSLLMDWLLNLDRNITISYFNGSGDVLYRINFVGIEPYKHFCKLDYIDSSEIVHKIILSYCKLEVLNIVER